MANKYLDQITKNTTNRVGFDISGMSKKQQKNLSIALQNLMPETETPLSVEPWMKGDFTSVSTGAKVTAPKSKLGLTAGDIVGIAGTIAGGITQMANTISAVKATKKNVNRFKGFNEKALATNKKLQNQIGMNKANAERNLERKMMLESNTAKARTRGMSSSISGLKANDLATDIGVREAKIAGFNQLEDIFGQQMIGAFGQEEALLTAKDQMEMSAQERVDDKDQMDLDNAYSNFAQNFATITESTQKLGSDLNQAKHRRDFLDILPYTNPWGIGYEYKSGINGSPNMYSTRKYDKNAKTKIVAKPVAPVGYNVPFMELPEIDGYDSKSYPLLKL